MKRMVLAGLAVAAAVAGAAGANFPLGTFVFTGSVVDWQNEACALKDGLTVRAATEDGRVLASGKVVDPTDEGTNYRLEIPVASEASAKSAALGDVLYVEVVSAGGTTNVSSRALPPLDRANAVERVNLVSTRVTEFESAEGVKLVVSDDYLDGIAPMMADAGHDSYDPGADWDGDGVSNFQEYMAGTNPFDASDVLQIKEFVLTPENYRITFEYSGGHIYAIGSETNLLELPWKNIPFATAEDSSSVQERIFFPGTEDGEVGETTLYLAPEAGFYIIRAE